MTVKESFQKYYLTQIGKQASLDNLLLFIYAIGVITLTYFSQHYKVDEKKYLFQIISTVLGILSLISFAFLIVTAVLLFGADVSYQSASVQKFVKISKPQIQVLMILNIVLYIFPMAMNYKRAIIDIFVCLKDYLYFSPAYFHTLLIYAFCNVNDLSWGTKGMDSDTKSQQSKLEKDFLQYKVEFIFTWIGKNALVAIAFILLNQNQDFRNYFILCFGYYSTTNLAIKALSAFLFMVQYVAIDKPKYKIAILKKMRSYAIDKERLQDYIQEVHNQLNDNLELSDNLDKNDEVNNAWLRYPSLNPTVSTVYNQKDAVQEQSSEDEQDEIEEESNENDDDDDDDESEEGKKEKGKGEYSINVVQSKDEIVEDSPLNKRNRISSNRLSSQQFILQSPTSPQKNRPKGKLKVSEVLPWKTSVDISNQNLKYPNEQSKDMNKKLPKNFKKVSVNNQESKQLKKSTNQASMFNKK